MIFARSRWRSRGGGLDRSGSPEYIEPSALFVAQLALRWSSGDLDGDHLVCVVSERVTADYLTILREKGISYVVAGEPLVDLTEAVNQLGEHFGIRTLLLEGGSHINGAFLQVGLVDEVSL
jgi:2,5-diamino-6-(ribosylamino)-4(3H)-pyrimidinone 5'-phosphate reductase